MLKILCKVLVITMEYELKNNLEDISFQNRNLDVYTDQFNKTVREF